MKIILLKCHSTIKTGSHCFQCPVTCLLCTFSYNIFHVNFLFTHDLMLCTYQQPFLSQQCKHPQQFSTNDHACNNSSSAPSLLSQLLTGLHQELPLAAEAFSCSSVFLFPCEISLFKKLPGLPSAQPFFSASANSFSRCFWVSSSASS